MGESVHQLCPQFYVLVNRPRRWTNTQRISPDVNKQIRYWVELQGGLAWLALSQIDSKPGSDGVHEHAPQAPSEHATYALPQGHWQFGHHTSLVVWIGSRVRYKDES